MTTAVTPNLKGYKKERNKIMKQINSLYAQLEGLKEKYYIAPDGMTWIIDDERSMKWLAPVHKEVEEAEEAEEGEEVVASEELS